MLKEEHRGRDLAIKDLRNEIAIMARLAHPGVLRVRGVGEASPGRPFLILERLTTVLAAVLPKPADQALGATRPYSASRAGRNTRLLLRIACAPRTQYISAPALLADSWLPLTLNLPRHT